MKKGLTCLLSKPYRFVPFFRISIHALHTAISIYFKSGVDNFRKRFILSRIKREKHNLIVRVRSQY